MTQIPFFDLSEQNRLLLPEFNEAWAKVIRHPQFILGQQVEEFEAAFAHYIGTRFAVGVNSGLDALSLAVRGLGIGPGDDVIVPANSFIATALGVSHAGANLILVDVHRDSLLMDANLVEAKLTPQTKAIIPVHLYGETVKMSSLQALAKKHRLFIIEDAAQAHGARYQNRRCGSLGDVGCFSFYPSKNLGAFGDGGIVTTDDEALAKRLRVLRNYGSQEKNLHEVQGFNSRLDTLQAAILQIKLPHLEAWNDKRRALAKRYASGLQGISELHLPGASGGSKDENHVYHLYVIRSKHRDALHAHLTRCGIATAIHYPRPIHRQPVYEPLGHPEGSFPIAEESCREILSLPIYPEMAVESIDQVVKAICDFFRK